MARRLKWETSAWSASSRNTDAIASLNAAGGVAIVPLVAPGVVEAADRDHIWVERIVGSVVFQTLNVAGVPAPCNLKERIGVGYVQDPSVAPPTSSVGLPWNTAHSVDNFLWERVNVAQPSLINTGLFEDFSLALGGVNVPYWSSIDVRVGRSLRPRMFLSYTLQTDPQSPGGDIIYAWGWLRVLISE